MDRERKRQRKTPLRILAAAIAVMLTVTLLPTDMLTAWAAGTDLETDGGAVTWDFREQSAAIYQAAGEDGSLSVKGSISYNGAQHGANIGNDTVFSLNVPAGQTTLTFSVCSYGSSVADISAGDKVLEQDFVLKGASTDGQTSSVQYTSDTPATITIAISGTGYLHSITAETITPPQIATVSGSVYGNPADGETLLFTAEDGNVTETEISNGAYSVSLPVGHTYTVSFENSDIYAVTDGAMIDLTNAENGDSIPGADITCRMIWNDAKEFSFAIHGTTYTVTPGESPSEDFEVTAEGGNGSVELATTDTAIIWADLEGAGVGTLMSDSLEDVSADVTYDITGNIIQFTYKDQNTSPAGYTIQVKDNSASGTPRADGETRTYNFRDGSVISTLHTDAYPISGGATVSSTDGLVTLIGNNRIRYNDASHGIMIGNGD